VARVVRNPLVYQLMRLGILVFAARHRIGVGVVGFNQQGQLLLLRHVFHPKSPWGIPGGWLDRNEAPDQCALRELREETGIRSAVLGPVIYIHREETPPHLGIYYKADIKQDPLALSSEIIEWGWFELDDLPDKMLPAMLVAIEKAGKNNE
jgi:ADP-ribose pyrophosphatase YjhB (NUDIX family)